MASAFALGFVTFLINDELFAAFHLAAITIAAAFVGAVAANSETEVSRRVHIGVTRWANG